MDKRIEGRSIFLRLLSEGRVSKSNETEKPVNRQKDGTGYFAKCNGEFSIHQHHQQQQQNRYRPWNIKTTVRKSREIDRVESKCTRKKNTYQNRIRHML